MIAGSEKEPSDHCVSLMAMTMIMKSSVVENILRIFIPAGQPGRHKGQMTENTRRRNPGHPSITLKTQGKTFGHPMVTSNRHLKSQGRSQDTKL